LIVFDASTLIILAKSSILREVLAHHKAVIPSIVQRECTVDETREDAKLIARLIEEGFLKIMEPQQTGRISKLIKDFQLDRGEAIALHLAWELKAPLATDDTPTRKACRVLNIRSIIAIAFLEKLVQRGIISPALALEKLKKLKRYGRYNAETIEAIKASIKKKGG
jgi:predicted nucleic acid-binding protein